MVCSACSDETTGPVEAEFEQLCGQDQPVRIFAVDPAELPESVHAAPFGDRYLVDLSHSRAEGGEVTGGRVSEVWSVGQCGADPVLLATTVDINLKQFDPYPDVVFACRDADRALLALDPSGASPANPVFATHNCFALPTPAGLVTILAANADDPTGTLVLQPWPDDPFSEAAEQIVLLDEVNLDTLPNTYTGSATRDVLAATDDEVFAVTPTNELVAVSLDDFGLTLLATEVSEFELGPDGAWVVWQDVQVTSDESGAPAGPLWLLNRASNEVTALGDGALGNSGDPFLLASLGVLFFRDAANTTQFLELASLTSIGLSPQLLPLRVLDDARVLFGTVGGAPYVVANVKTGEATALYEGEGHPKLRDEGMLVFESVFVGGGELDTQARELVHISYSGESKLLAEHVLAGYEVASDHRVVTPFGIDSDGVGQLVVVNPDTLIEQHIADNVVASSTSIYEPVAGEMIVSYLVVDADPERHGLWVAKPAK